MRISAPLVPALLVTLLGCGNTDESSPAEVPVDYETMRFETPEFDVPPGDSFECFYLDAFSEKEMAVIGSDGQQDKGGHHILLYWTDTPQDPQHHPCDDAEMLTWRQIAGSGGDAATDGDQMKLPDGLAIQVPAGKQLVIQAHYINTTGAAYKAKDWVSVRHVEPSTIDAYVNYFVTLDASFQVPPKSEYTHTTECVVQDDLTTVLNLGHMHEAGKHFSVEVVNEAGETERVIRDEDWALEYASHPPVSRYTREEPLFLPKGTRLRQSCTWDNPTDEMLGFPREMCLAFFYYYPDAGEKECLMQPVTP